MRPGKWHFEESDSGGIDRASQSWCLPSGWLEVRHISLGTEPCIERERDNVTVLHAVISVVAANPVLELENFGNGIVELPAFGVPVADDVQSVRVRRESVFDRLDLGVERVGDRTQSAGVGGVIGHVSCSGRSGIGG